MISKFGIRISEAGNERVELYDALSGVVPAGFAPRRKVKRDRGLTVPDWRLWLGNGMRTTMEMSQWGFPLSDRP